MIEDKLNLTYYSGQDLYSDGDVEEELLAAVQDMEQVEQKLIEGNSWPHLYHLSNIRENILEWYPFNPKGSLLEIGSGCGALSGLFCSKVDHVVAIELSKRRSMINATRNEKHDNLTIMLGNFEDIKLTEKFDYVTLIGVFEYSICYINSDNPFMDMLKKAKSFLKPGGKLLIAIENKYGLKYFAGATEDHTGRNFDGLENYVGVDRVRTFSRKTLEKMLTDAGFTGNDFYYPMPDYKLPDTIYSDVHLPSLGSVRSACVSYDRDRYELIDERLAFDAICEDGMFGDLANSFLIVSSNGGDDSTNEQVEYAKYNRLRMPQFQIATKMKQVDGKRFVEKLALRKEAVPHILAMQENAKKLEKAFPQMSVAPIYHVGDDFIDFEFVDGQGLFDKVAKTFGNKERFVAAVCEAMNQIYREEATAEFAMTKEFELIFGTFTKEEKAAVENWKMKSYAVSNVDSTFGNFIEKEDGTLVCLDYEWVFDFPVPVDYLKYRTAYYFYSENRAYIQPMIGEKEYLELFGLRTDMLPVFAKMDDAFQQYVHGKDRKYIYTRNYEKKVINLGKNLQMGEPWFLSIAGDVDKLNRTLGEHRRDLVECKVDMHRRSEFLDKCKRAVKNPGMAVKKIKAKMTK